jgi:diaminopimelate decarboxylase
MRDNVLLEYRDDVLHWTGCNLSSLADRFETPLHVCCREAILQSAEAFQSPFEKAGLNLRYHFSVKTNPIPEFLRILKDMSFGVEVVSPYELWLVRRLGFEGDDVVVTGLERGAEFCLSAARTRPRMWTLESVAQLQFLESLSERFAAPVNVGLRICPTLRHNRFNLTVSSGSYRSPYGFLPGSTDLDTALQTIAGNDNFNFVGFHFHLGSGILSSRPYELALEVISDVVLSAAEKGSKIRFVNIGGGFGSATAPIHSTFNLFRLFFGFNKRKKVTPYQNNFLFEVASALKEFIAGISNYGVVIEEVLVEPGRAISAPAQIMLLTVKEVIERHRRRHFLICDGGAMSLSPMLLLEHRRVIPLKSGDGKLVNYTILGNMPSSLDMVAASMPLPKMRPGDRLAVLDTGAYFFSFNNNFAGPRPAVVMIENGRFRSLRRRETYEDLVSCDLEFRSNGTTSYDNIDP